MAYRARLNRKPEKRRYIAKMDSQIGIGQIDMAFAILGLMV
jgi:hypothetical protein